MGAVIKQEFYEQASLPRKQEAQGRHRAALSEETAVIHVGWETGTFGHFCGLYGVLVFISIMEWPCFCLVLSPSQRELVTYVSVL